jgi:putative salt-induced outer membrane protein
MWKQACWGLAGALTVCAAARADDDDAWAARAAAGFTRTGGITNTSSANALFHIAYVFDDWKLLFGSEALYGSTRGETTAQAWDAHLQANYNLNPRLYWYSALRYDDNRFSGFAYQELVSSGLGYQFFNSDATKLSAQLGIGVRRLRPELLTEDPTGGITATMLLPPTTEAVLDAGVNFNQALNAYTHLIASVAVEAGSSNTMTTANLSVQVKMSSTLALSAGYQLIRNSQPPPGVGTSATLTTLSLVYEVKNPKLAPD